MRFQNTKPVAASLVKPYLKKLTLCVHPDFFHGDAVKSQHNAQSLQQLYTILDPILRPATTNATPVDPIRLKFYNKLASSKTQRRKQLPSMTQDVVFSDPKQTWSTVNSFYSLCQQLDISVLPSDQDAVRSMVLQQQQQQPKGRKPHRSLGEEFAQAFYQEQQQPKQQPQDWTRARILDQTLFMCDPQLDSRRVADKLVQWLPQLHPEQWWGKMPTLFLSAKGPLDAKGVLILHDAMTLEDMDKYIQQHLKVKMKEYQDQQAGIL